jgi:hypothetical protein
MIYYQLDLVLMMHTQRSWDNCMDSCRSIYQDDIMSNTASTAVLINRHQERCKAFEIGENVIQIYIHYNQGLRSC